MKKLLYAAGILLSISLASCQEETIEPTTKVNLNLLQETNPNQTPTPPPVPGLQGAGTSAVITATTTTKVISQ